MGFGNNAMRAFAAAALFFAAPASAQDIPPQDISPLIGQWIGDVTEALGAETTRYRMFVSFAADLMRTFEPFPPLFHLHRPDAIAGLVRRG